MLIILFILLNIIFVSTFFVKNNNLKKFRLNLLCDSDSLPEKNSKKIFNLDKDLFETYIHYDAELINLELIDKYKPFYYIIGPKNHKNYLLIEDMKHNEKTGIFINKNSFSKETLDLIYKKYINDPKYLYDNDSWIFDDNKFLGDINEFYKNIFF